MGNSSISPDGRKAGPGTHAHAPPPERPLASLKTTSAVFLALLARGLWPVGLYPRGVKRRETTTEGKEPFGKEWGLKRWSPDRWHDLVKIHPAAGCGVCLGPGRGPGGKWLIDAEGDGPEAEESRARLFGGEIVATLGWGSVRGGHQLFTADGERLGVIVAKLKPFQVKTQNQPGVFHIPTLQGLELRCGGFKDDGIAKQLQSAVPPTPGTDGKPREWNGVETIADVPESFYANLEAAVLAATPTAAATSHGSTARSSPSANRGDAWLKKALENGCGKIATAPNNTRHATLLSQVRTLAGYLHYHEKHGVGFSEGQLISDATEAADRAAPERKGAENRRCVEDAITNGKANPLEMKPELHLIAIGAGAAVSSNDQAAALSAVGPSPSTNGNGHHAEPKQEAEEQVIDLFPKINPIAFHGIAGEIVRMADPHNEGDPTATLIQFLVAFGNMVGHNAHFVVGATHHYLNMFVTVIGMTAIGRKGTSWDIAKFILGCVDPDWKDNRIMGGLVSGEGLIHNVRDESTEERPVKKGPKGAKETALADPGVKDKRLLVVETEFSRVLKSMNRDTNTLSDVIRQAWDGGHLRTMGKNNPAKATGAHISIIAHATQADVRRHLTATDSANGFANRHLWPVARQSKSLPDGGELYKVDWRDVTNRLRDSAEYASQVGKMTRNRGAAEMWHGVYEHLNAGRPGLLGAILSRAVPQTMRLACIYALLDRSPQVNPEHLMAALALWDYCEVSARFVFGDALGDSDAEKLLAALKKAPNGLSRTEIANDVFNKHKVAKAIVVMLSELLTSGAIHRRSDNATGGRPAERWYAGKAENGHAE